MQDSQSRIKELIQMKEAGHISQADFEQMKAEILAAQQGKPKKTRLKNDETDWGLHKGSELRAGKSTYRVTKHLGKGGMGEVWQVDDVNASQRQPETQYKAIKVLPIDLAESKEHLELLKDEADLTAALSHSRIINVFGLYESDGSKDTDGIPFILMAYLQGQNLDQRLQKQGVLNWQQAELWLTQVAEALDYTWNKHRLIHRDLKPSNLFITEDQEIVLLDFGLAWRIRKSQLSLSNQQVDDNSSRGTVAYMPPEAFANTAPDPRQDIYAFACVCYQMLTGETPYPPEAARMRDESLFPDAPEQLNKQAWGILKQGLAYKKENRPESAGQLIKQLKQAQNKKGQVIEPPKPPKKNKTLLIIGLLVLGIGAGLITTHESNTPENDKEVGRISKAHPAKPQDNKIKQQKLIAQRQVAEQQRQQAMLKQQQAQTQKTIQTLLSQAKKDISQKRLSKPTGNNALEKYQQILQLEANNQQAQQGITQVTADYIQLSETAEQNHQFDKAKAYLKTAKTIQPDNPEIAQAAQQLLKQELVYQQAQAEQQKRDAEKLEQQQAMAKEQAKQAEIAKQKGLAIKMVSVPAGCFQMGSNDGGGDEKPVHRICLSAYAIGQYEVTKAQWQKVMGNNPSKFKGSHKPVERVSWDDVQGFIHKLNQQSQQNYRLPTEAEWEYACRGGGKDQKYCGSNNLNSVAWYDKNSGSSTHDVGQKQANGLGLYDMTGNVWEWVSDGYDSDYYKNSPTNDPQGSSSGRYRVIRGGSWYNSASYLRSANRGNGSPGSRSSYLGFRLVRKP